MDQLVRFRKVIPETSTAFVVPSAVGFDPTTLFAGGQTGSWYDPSDHTTTFQDAAGTTPATADGQAVKRINDKSGNGNHLIVGAIGWPTLKNSGSLWWLLYDQIEQGGQEYLVASFTFTIPLTRIMAAQVVTYAAFTTLWGGATPTNCPLNERPSTPTIAMGPGTIPTNDMTVGINHVVTEIWNNASSSLTVDNGTAATGDLTGATDPAGIQMSGSGGTDFNFYGGIQIGRVLTSGEIANCRTFFGAKAGLVL